MTGLGAPLRWSAILVFCTGPLLGLALIFAFCPELPSEMDIKMELFRAHPPIDTLVIGDSRVMDLPKEPFSKRGWSFFNMGMDGLCPEEPLLMLEYSLAHGGIRRVVMGVSFENMADGYPLGCGSVRNEPSLRGLDLAARGFPEREWRLHLRARLRGVLVSPFNKAAVRFQGFLNSPAKMFRQDGSTQYLAIEKAIRDGIFDFRLHRDAVRYFNREDSEAGYLRTGELSPYAKKVYGRLFARVRELGIPLLMFETGRTAQYQALIDADPRLVRLQEEWRGFFTAQSGGLVRFIPLRDLASSYDPEDFFDACHVTGKTSMRLSERLASEMASLEKFGAGPR